jgi:formylglycine-generating enzyme required for sulfatase activity
MGKLFISYRRDDTQDITARIHERLKAHFGADSIFIDFVSIPLGHDFRDELREAVNASNAVLVIIGKQWLTITDEREMRRLDNPNDFVRIEVEAALARNIPVVPVLTQGARIPREHDLPPSLAALAYRNGTDVRSDHHFSGDVDQLIARLTPAMAQPQPVPEAAQSSPQMESRQASSRYPLPAVPERLAQLGFRGVNITGAPAIVPSICEVPGGPFMMGSDPARDPDANGDEQPQHRVEVPYFRIARYPVTVAEYALAVLNGGVPEPSAIGGQTWQAQLQHPDYPVVCVTWLNARAYARWLSSVTQKPWRLANEAQWEKAARWDPIQRASRIYPWGDTFDRMRCNTRANGAGRTLPVGSFPAQDPARSGASPCGAEDMIGNVWEWTDSLYQSYPFSITDDASADPTEHRAMRGASWLDDKKDARAAFRFFNRAENNGDLIGFRLIC